VKVSLELSEDADDVDRRTPTGALERSSGTRFSAELACPSPSHGGKVRSHRIFLRSLFPRGAIENLGCRGCDIPIEKRTRPGNGPCKIWAVYRGRILADGLYSAPPM